MWDTFHRTWIYGLMLMLIVGCVSCSMGDTKPSLNKLLDTMSKNCIHGPKKQRARPDSDANEELPADVEVECADPPARIVYGT